MIAVPVDLAIVGAALAIAVTILALSGLALYVAFRIRETLRDENGRSARVVKVAFLVGLLFLSGGMFYFFASGLNHQALGTPVSTSSSGPSLSTSSSSTGTSSSTETTSNASSGPTTNRSSTTTSASGTATSTVTSTTTVTTTSTTSSPSSSTSTTTSSSGSQAVSMSAPQCPTQVAAGSTFQCTIYIYNVGGTTFASSTLTASGTFFQFSFVGCTESVNGGPSNSVSFSAHTVSIGDLVPGTTAMTLTIMAPSQAGSYNNNVLTLAAPGLSQQVSDTFTLQVTH